MAYQPSLRQWAWVLDGGRIAYEIGKGLDENPFGPNEPEYGWWQDGWRRTEAKEPTRWNEESRTSLQRMFAK